MRDVGERDVALTIYRAMRSNPDGLPAIGRWSSTLGVRVSGPWQDIPVDANGDVAPNTGGMSVVMDDPRSLPRARRPRSLGGVGRHPVFCLDCEKLPPTLLVRPSGRPHALVEPSAVCKLSEYEQALHSTQPDWRITHE